MIPAKHDYEAADPARLPARPDVSVSMVTYNHGQYLAQALDSILAQQRNFSMEIVVAEDCSTDNTRAIALDYQRRHPDVVRVLYSDRNVGIWENGRRLFSAFRGRYIAGLDGDDYWTEPTKLQRQYDGLEARPDIKACFTRGFRLFSDGRLEPDWDYGPSDRVISRRELLQGSGIIVPSGSAFYRAPVVRDTPDWVFEAPVIDLFHLLSGSSPNGALYLPIETVAYRINARGSWTESYSADYWRTAADYSRRMLDSLQRAQDAFAIPAADLQNFRSLPHYVLGRDAWSRGQYAASAGHFLRMGPRYLWRRAGEIPGRLRTRGRS